MRDEGSETRVGKADKSAKAEDPSGPMPDEEQSPPKLWDAIAATIFLTIIFSAIAYWVVMAAIMTNE